MNVEKAHGYLENAENTIRHFFLPTDTFDVICHLLKLSRKAESLGMAVAYAKAALHETNYGGGNDEISIVVNHIMRALGELEYQRKRDDQ